VTIIKKYTQNTKKKKYKKGEEERIREIIMTNMISQD
jgi:hypothetical protein